MFISDVSVRRPVFAMVVSLLLVIFGLMALDRLSVREYPDIDPPVVSIDTTYRGASAAVVETKITQVIEDRIAGLEGIRKLTSTSSDERSRIRVEFGLNRDVDAAANDIRDRVARVVDNLPDEAEPPEIAKVDSNTRPVMYINLTSDRMSTLELSDFAERNLVDRLSVVDGVARVRVSGARRYAMRIWLDREALAARQLTVTDIEDALRRENVELPAGRLESTEREFTLRTETGLISDEQFRQLVVGRGQDGFLIRLGEVAKVEIGAENERNAARANTIPAVSLAIEQLSRANTVEVSHGVRDQLEIIRPTLPDGILLQINFDRATFIEASMIEVAKALLFALTLVLVVIYLFLGSLRATLIPAVVVPVSIIATFIVMAAMGYSVNVLILLGLVLAIGLVVDDAIVVLENIYRRIEDGQPKLLAAIDGSREIGFAVIATTLVLVAVFLPISFIQGNVGRLFSEFGIALAAAVLFSSIVALTLTPMMCSKILHGDTVRSGLAHRVDRFFRALGERYRSWLRGIVRHPWAIVAIAIVISLMAAFLFRVLPQEYAPKEDRGVFIGVLNAPEGASFEYTDRYTRQMEEALMEEVATGDVMRVLIRLPASFGSTGEVNSARAIALLAPWDERERSAEEIAASVRAKLSLLPGVRTAVITPQGLGVRGNDRPVRMILGGGEYSELALWAERMIERAEENPGLTNFDVDYDERKPQMRISIDRNRAADLGVSLANIGRTLETMLGSRIVTTYLDRGLEYNVVLQGLPEDRASPSDLTNLNVRSERTGQMVPLNNIVALKEVAGAAELSRFNRLRAVTVSASLNDGYSLGEAISYLEDLGAEMLPPSVSIDWDGESREFKEAGGSLYSAFLLALIIVFLVLAAQFESFRHPFIIMTTVPLAVTGAMIGLWLYGYSINVFTQIGAILLIGLAAKNGVLIVEFANQLRDRGVEFLEAVVEAAAIRLRPVLMTSTCTTIGAVPLLIADGPGAESRQAIGVVIVFGVTFSTLLTLFVIPAFYALFARNSKSPQYVNRMIEKLKKEPAAAPADPAHQP